MSVYRAVEQMVEYGLKHRDLSGITAIGVDEVAHAKGHKYLTVVYQLDSGCRRLLHVSAGPSVRSLLGFFRMLKKADQSRAWHLPLSSQRIAWVRRRLHSGSSDN